MVKKKIGTYLQRPWQKDKKFDGKRYEYLTSYFKKKDATEKKKFLKRQGWLVRIVKIRDFYVLYGRSR